MSDTKDLKLSFTGVTVHSEDLVVVTTVRGDLDDDEEIDHEQLFFHEEGEWENYDAENVNVISVAIDESGDEISMMSPDGFVLRSLPGGRVMEEVDASDDGPSSLVQLRQIKSIDGRLIVAGMARRVYARGTGKKAAWDAIDQGCFAPRGTRKGAIGFNSIDGWSIGDLIAVGYKGEIWRRRKETWTQLDSPTNVTLMAVACDPGSRNFVAVGLGGVVLLGNDDEVRLVADEEPLGNLLGAVHFEGAFYLASDEAVYRLDAPDFDTAAPVQLSARGKPTAGSLSAAEGVIWSVGERDMFMSNDGAKWKRIPNP